MTFYHSQRVRVAVLPDFFEIILVAALSSLLTVFLFLPAFGQEEEPALSVESAAPPPETAPVQEVASPEPAAQIETTEPTNATDEPLPTEVQQDIEVNLGAQEATILPDSPLYFVKQGWRGFREAITFDPLKKAELKVEYANQVMGEVQQVFDEKADDPEALEAATQAIDGVEARLSEVAAVASSLKEEGGAEGLVRGMLDQHFKHQKFFDAIEVQVGQQAPTDASVRMLDRMAEAKEKTAGHAGAIATGIVTDTEQFARLTDEVMAQQSGSEFKHLKNLEVLKRVEDQVPPEAREAMQRAQENALKRFKDDIQGIEKDVFAQKFNEYARHITGDETRLFEIIDGAKGDLADAIDPAELERMKETMAQRFAQRLGNFEEQFSDEEFKARMQERFFKRFEEGRGEHLRTITQLQERIETAAPQASDEITNKIKTRVEEGRKKSVESFKQTFDDSTSQDQVRRFEELSRTLSENPDPVTFKLLQDLEAEVKTDPNKRAFIERLQQNTQDEFKRQFEAEGDQFINRFVTDDPRHIEVLQSLQQRFGSEGVPAARLGIERALERQTDVIKQRLEGIENPQEFDSYKERFNNIADPEAAQRIRTEIIRRQGNDFAQFFIDKETEIRQRELEIEFTEEHIGEESITVEQNIENRVSHFKERIQDNPFCDATCRAEETQRFREHVNTAKPQFEGQPLQFFEGQPKERPFEEPFTPPFRELRPDDQSKTPGQVSEPEREQRQDQPSSLRELFFEKPVFNQPISSPEQPFEPFKPQPSFEPFKPQEPREEFAPTPADFGINSRSSEPSFNPAPPPPSGGTFTPPPSENTFSPPPPSGGGEFAPPPSSPPPPSGSTGETTSGFAPPPSDAGGTSAPPPPPPTSRRPLQQNKFLAIMWKWF